MSETKRVGLIGAGTIGRTILTELQSLTGVEIAFVLVRDPSAHADLDLPEGCVIADEALALERGADLVVEAAMADIVQRLAPDFLRHGDFCGFSSTALADRATEAAVREAALTHGRRFYVPHGAVLGLDGLGDGQGLIDSVTITTTKSGRSLGIDPDTEGAIFDGPTRDACHRFPRNVNVHAAIALAGLGFDRTISRIVAVPGLVDMKHRIEVTGQGLAWDLGITSRSLGGVTGAYTPRSAAGTVRRILGGAGVVVA